MIDYENLIEKYREIYSLPELTYKERVDFSFFRLCRPDYHFTVVSIYNEKRELLLFRDLNKNIGWELVGGYVEKNENLEEAVNRIVLKEVGLGIDELQPVAIINNYFEWNEKTILHRGIAFIALSRGPIKNQPQNVKIVYTKDAPSAMMYQNKKIFYIAQKIIETKLFEPPYKEIESANKFFIPHIINKYFVKSIGRLASQKIRKKILELVNGNPDSIIDVSCGDDDLIFELEKKYNPGMCIGNDISWKTLSLIRNRQNRNNVMLINHNVIDLPLNKKFDLVIFKNTLHHIPQKEQAGLVKNLSDFSRQLIIVDINDPFRSNFLAKIWNWYYVHFLGDQGGYFLSFQEFKDLVRNNTKDRKAEFGMIDTIKGGYFYASIYDNKNSEEVEIKVKIDSSEIEKIKKKLYALGARYEGETKEWDIYFTAPHRDFIKTRECLRIREKKGKIELTYKGPTTSLMKKARQFWKPEINLDLNCAKEDMCDFLEMLNFRKVVDVIKERQKFTLSGQTITLDNIKKAGWFLEIEKIVHNKNERENAIIGNNELLRKLGIGPENIVTAPYRDIVLKHGR